MPDHALATSLRDIDVVFLDLGGVLIPDPWETVVLTPEVGLADCLNVDRNQATREGVRLFNSFAVRAKAEERDFWHDFGCALGIEIGLEMVSVLERELVTPSAEAASVLNGLSACNVGIGVISNNTSFWFAKQKVMTGLDSVANDQLQFLSFRCGVTKDDLPGLFELAAAIVEPSTSLVVDDRDAHTQRASELGFQALHYSLASHRSLLKAIERRA